MFINSTLAINQEGRIDLDAVTKPYASNEALASYRRLNEAVVDPHAPVDEHAITEEHGHDTKNLDTVLFLFLCAAVG